MIFAVSKIIRNFAKKYGMGYSRLKNDIMNDY